MVSIRSAVSRETQPSLGNPWGGAHGRSVVGGENHGARRQAAGAPTGPTVGETGAVGGSDLAPELDWFAAVPWAGRVGSLHVPPVQHPTAEGHLAVTLPGGICPCLESNQ
jgi:hypothetical protein